MSAVWAVEVLDELVGDDGSVVLVAVPGGHRVVRLSTLGQAVRELATGGVPFEKLVAGLVDRFGSPPGPDDAVETVRAAVDSRESEGVVRVVG
jgi:hypothetical protein